MVAILSAFAEWLSLFLTSLAQSFLRSLAPSMLLSLGLGIGVYTGLSQVSSSLQSVVFQYHSMPAAMLDIARLAGVVFDLKLFASAFSVRVSMLASRVFFVRSV